MQNDKTFKNNGTLSSSSYKAVASWSGEGALKVHSLINQEFIFWKKMQNDKTFKNNGTLSSASYKAVASWSGEGALKVHSLINQEFTFWKKNAKW